MLFWYVVVKWIVGNKNPAPKLPKLAPFDISGKAGVRRSYRKMGRD
jgi:hypothetical protein